ncbi:MAG: metal ABC transporter permease [Lachnospiraceae bacterium]|nr:metal ABC transporter permease [Lachnospiraceae bacterium]
MMELVGKVLDLLPLEFLEYDFMKYALMAVLIITPLFGILGTMIVNNRMAFFSDALGHSAFTGMAVGVLFGIGNTNVSMMLFAVVFALLLNFIRHKNIVSSDTVISVFSSLSVAVGLAILSKNGNFSKYSALMVGDILSITPGEIRSLFLILIVTLVFWCVAYNGLHSIGINSSLAKSKGIPVKLLDNAFVVLVALIVMLSIRWVGILIINALLILPAAAARNIAADNREYHLFSVMISVFSGVLGLILSYYLNVAAGPMLVLVAAIIFFITFLARRLFRG